MATEPGEQGADGRVEQDVDGVVTPRVQSADGVVQPATTNSKPCPFII